MEQGRVLAEGKTKRIVEGPEKGTVLLETFDVLTGGDAAKRAQIAGIGAEKTAQAANTFALLNKRGIPTAFKRQVSPTVLLCDGCDMLPLEIVVRRYAYGSYLLRNPGYRAQGAPHRFKTPVWEFFHKHTAVDGRHPGGPCQMGEEEARALYLREGVWAEGVYTDPYISLSDEVWTLYPQKEDQTAAKPLLNIAPVLSKEEVEWVVSRIVLPTFGALETAWAKVITQYGPVALVDMKLEVGRRQADGQIVIADVIDNDSWRIWPGADPKKQLDKQSFRENHPLGQVSDNYKMVTQLTAQFAAE